jgi:hypothetical protein
VSKCPMMKDGIMMDMVILKIRKKTERKNKPKKK